MAMGRQKEAVATRLKAAYEKADTAARSSPGMVAYSFPYEPETSTYAGCPINYLLALAVLQARRFPFGFAHMHAKKCWDFGHWPKSTNGQTKHENGEMELTPA